MFPPEFRRETRGVRTVAKNKSEAIRKLLTAVPDVRAKHAREIFAEEGIDISLDLFRVVRSAWRKDRREQVSQARTRNYLKTMSLPTDEIFDTTASRTQVESIPGN
jgi:hypothetical protein